MVTMGRRCIGIFRRWQPRLRRFQPPAMNVKLTYVGDVKIRKFDGGSGKIHGRHGVLTCNIPWLGCLLPCSS